MLELRPSCEHCDTSLPPNATNAMICTFECTFCRDCVENVLENVCPNCGGGFVPRPIRPAIDRRGGNSLVEHPAGTRKVHRPVSRAEHRAFAEALKAIPPEER